MKRKVLEFFREFLVIQMNHLSFITIGITVMGLMNREDAMYLYWLLASVIPLYHYFLRIKISKIYFFFALHIVAPVLCFITPMPDIVFKVLLCFSVILYSIWSCVVKIKGDTEAEELFHPIFTVVVIGGTSILQSIFGREDYGIYYFIMVFYFLLCFFIYSFIVRYQNFMEVNQYSASNIPEKEIFHVGFRQTIIYTVLGLGLIFMTANVEWMAYVMKILAYGILTVIRTFLVWLGGDTTEEIDPTEQIWPTDNSGGGGMPVSQGETFIVWKILEYIVLPLTVIAIFAAIFYGLFKLIRYILQNFKLSRRTAKEASFGIDVREAVEIEKGERSGFRLFIFKDNRDKIRKVFKKYILKEKHTIIGELDKEMLTYLTAKECCDKLSAEELKKVYEKTRYSEETITSEDMRVLKGL